MQNLTKLEIMTLEDNIFNNSINNNYNLKSTNMGLA